MGAYEENLRHLAEPGSPSEATEAVSISLEDYEALWFTEALREFEHYGDKREDEQDGIALGYASYIDKKVRDQGASHVDLFVHTELAGNTLMDALYDHIPETGKRDQYPIRVFRSLEDTIASMMGENYITEEDL